MKKTLRPKKIIKERIKKIKEAILKKQRRRLPKASHIGKMEVKGGVMIIRIKGNITFDTFDEVQNEHNLLLPDDMSSRNILVDFKYVKRTDTAVVAALVDRLKTMRAYRPEGTIGLVNLSPNMRRLLEISKTKALFREYKSEQEAIEHLK